MEIHYKRTHKDSYMVIEQDTYTSDYEEQMLKENQIRSLLSFYTMQINGKIQFWYDISGKQSLRDYLEQTEITLDVLDQIVLYLILAYEDIHKFLLKQERVCLQPETVYVGRQEPLHMYLCYCPFDIAQEPLFSSIMEYILTLIDHKQELLMQLCYRLYQMTLQEGTTLYDLHCCIQDAMEQNALSQNGESYRIEREAEGSMIPEEESFTQSTGIQVEEEDKWTETGERMTQEGESQDIYYVSGANRALQEILTLGQKIKEMIQGWLHQIGNQPPRKEDFLIEPEPRAVEPTVLLHQAKQPCEGKLLYQGTNEEENYVIRREVFGIGSDGEKNDACLHSSAVSRCHAKITRQENIFYIEDLNSTNGTFLNGKMLNYMQKYPLASMDRIAFADVIYVFM